MNVTIVGCGYVGEHVAAQLEAVGYEVSRYDPPRGMSALRPAQDAYLICVPTPLTATGGPDHRHVEQAAQDIAAVLDDDHPSLIVLESTVSPGATRRILGPLHERGHHVAFSPERVDPGHDHGDVPRLVAGIDEWSYSLAAGLYGGTVHISVTGERRVEGIASVVHCASLEVAELAKLHEQCYRAVNLALVDELAELCRAMDVDPHAVIDAAASKPFGFQRFDPGAGVGGHCVPVNPSYLLDAADEHSVAMPTLAAAAVRNARHPHRNVDRVVEAMGGKFGGRVAVLGLTYKPGVADTRGSAGTMLAGRLRALYDVRTHDSLSMRGVLPNALDAVCAWAGLVVVCTAHPEYLDLRSRTGTPILDLTGELFDAVPEAARVAA